MIDNSVIITVVPPVFAAIIAYAIARIKSNANERIQRAKIDAEVDTRAMDMVKGIMEEMRQELKKEIATLREENQSLQKQAKQNREEIEHLQKKLRESSELQDAMKIEIASLKNTIQWYENRLREANMSGSLYYNK